MVVKQDSSIKSAKDLAGRTVAVNTLQNIGDTTVRESVRKAGGDPSKVKFVEMPFDQMPAALDGGRVDAAWMGEPRMTVAKAQGARVVASPFAETDPKLTVATYFTSTQLTQREPRPGEEVHRGDEPSRCSTPPPTRTRPRQILATYTKISGDVQHEARRCRAGRRSIDMASLQKLASLG